MKYGLDKILLALPHRYPFLFIDEIIHFKKDRVIRTKKSFTYNEWFFPGHFPQFPIVPGNIISENMAQTLGLVIVDLDSINIVPLISYLANCHIKFLRKLTPGETIITEAKLRTHSPTILEGEVTVNLIEGEKVAYGAISIALS